MGLITTSRLQNDTVIAADIDESVAYSFTNAGSSWNGQLPTTSTYAGAFDRRRVQYGSGSILGSVTGSTVNFATVMLGTPTAIIPVTTSTAVALNVASANSSLFTVTSAASSATNIYYVAFFDG